MIARALVVALCVVPLSARAQLSSGRWAPEVRLDALAARTTAVHVAAGSNAAIGTYTRVGALVAGGVRRIAGEWRASGRVDVVARFHVDPFGESRWGAYAGGGASFLFDDGADGRTRALIVAGLEGPLSPRKWMAGIEAGLGGGARVGFTLRRARAATR